MVELRPARRIATACPAEAAPEMFELQRLPVHDLIDQRFECGDSALGIWPGMSKPQDGSGYWLVPLQG
jgi:hypothetical protein